MSPDPARRRVFARIILAYPVALTAVAVLVNLVLFDPSPPVAALAVSFASPDIGAAQLWILAFALARLGHGLGYLTGHDGLRGLSMSLGLIALYGLVSLPLLGLLV